jgi:hypothetical protein
MSKYFVQPIDFTGLRTVSLAARGGKVRIQDFATKYEKGAGIVGWLHSLPRILAADSMRLAVEAIMSARQAGKPIIWGIGGHVIKCGLAPVLIDLMKRGYATAFAMNGAAAIHDFEIAIAGHTSEDVDEVLPDGSFGAAEETGREMNRAISRGARDGIGIGEALGLRLDELGEMRYASESLLLRAWRQSAPVTVHVAVGTDTPHMHPAMDGASVGQATHFDFRLFCSLVALLDQGGVYLNVGSAVILPEVFLKAVSAVRNLGHPLRQFTTVSLDFIQHYRPRVNVVERPHFKAGGRGVSITGHHEILLPLLAACLIECET